MKLSLAKPHCKIVMRQRKVSNSVLDDSWTKARALYHFVRICFRCYTFFANSLLFTMEAMVWQNCPLPFPNSLKRLVILKWIIKFSKFPVLIHLISALTHDLQRQILGTPSFHNQLLCNIINTLILILNRQQFFFSSHWLFIITTLFS